MKKRLFSFGLLLSFFVLTTPMAIAQKSPSKWSLRAGIGQICSNPMGNAQFSYVNDHFQPSFNFEALRSINNKLKITMGNTYERLNFTYSYANAESITLTKSQRHY